MSPQGVQISGLRQTPNPDPANSNTDLNKEMINQVQNKNELAADVSVLKTQDKMIGALLDIVA
jgi:flagellar basal body rod protein FlgC